MRYSIFLVLLFLILAPQSSFAKAMAAGCFNPTGYDRNNVVSQTGLIFANILSSTSTTTAMASGTSGCKTNGIVREDKEAGVFLAQHVNEIQGELAMGQGEHIAAFTELVGCSDQVDVVTSSMRSNESPLVHRDFSDARVEQWLQSLTNRCQI